MSEPSVTQSPESSESPESPASGSRTSGSAAVPTRVAAPQRRPTRHAPGLFRRRSTWLHALELALDLIDHAADRVADATGVREPER